MHKLLWNKINKQNIVCSGISECTIEATWKIRRRMLWRDWIFQLIEIVLRRGEELLVCGNKILRHIFFFLENWEFPENAHKYTGNENYSILIKTILMNLYLLIAIQHFDIELPNQSVCFPCNKLFISASIIS